MLPAYPTEDLYEISGIPISNSMLLKSLLEDLVLLLHYRSSLILTPAILFREGFFLLFFYFLSVRKKCSFSEICSPRARMAQCQTSSLVTVCVGIIASFSNSALPPAMLVFCFFHPSVLLSLPACLAPVVSQAAPKSS